MSVLRAALWVYFLIAFVVAALGAGIFYVLARALRPVKRRARPEVA